MKLNDLIKDLPSAQIRGESPDDLMFKYMGGQYLIARDKTHPDYGYLSTDLPVYPIDTSKESNAELVRSTFKGYTIDEVHQHPESKEAHIHITQRFPLKSIPAELEEILAKRAMLNAELEERKLRGRATRAPNGAGR